jgi:hypothetical protein
MSVRIRSNLGGLTAATSRPSVIPNTKPQVGMVFGVITTKDTPTKELFEKNGRYSGIGTIFYLDYNQSKNFTLNGVDINTCKSAKPFHASVQNYPLVGELVQIIDAPSIASQVSANAGQKYYTGTINIWNDVQQNSPSTISLGKTFTEAGDIRKLISFEGDRIYQGRKGNGIRFGSTVKRFSDVNEWSSVGTDGDPITIIVNGYVTSNPSDSIPNVEEINKEKSSIYMTTSQKIPLIPGALIKNPFISSIEPNNYFLPQIILNSDRVTINSKKDEVLIYSQSNIELNTDNNITFNAGEIIHLHINEKNPNTRILLGTGPNGEIPFEPVLLGGQTHDLLLEMCNVLTTLAGFLSSVVVPTTEGGVLVTGCNNAGEQLLSDVYNIIEKLSKIQSNKVYTV